MPVSTPSLGGVSPAGGLGPQAQPGRRSAGSAGAIGGISRVMDAIRAKRKNDTIARIMQDNDGTPEGMMAAAEEFYAQGLPDVGFQVQSMAQRLRKGEADIRASEALVNLRDAQRMDIDYENKRQARLDAQKIATEQAAIAAAQSRNQEVQTRSRQILDEAGGDDFAAHSMFRAAEATASSPEIAQAFRDIADGYLESATALADEHRARMRLQWDYNDELRAQRRQQMEEIAFQHEENMRAREPTKAQAEALDRADATLKDFDAASGPGTGGIGAADVRNQALMDRGTAAYLDAIRPIIRTLGCPTLDYYDSRFGIPSDPTCLQLKMQAKAEASADFVGPKTPDEFRNQGADAMLGMDPALVPEWSPRAGAIAPGGGMDAVQDIEDTAENPDPLDPTNYVMQGVR